MNGPLQAGLVLILLAGVCQGSFMLPTKGMRDWAWENYWFIFAITAYLVAPWLLAFVTIPRLWEVYSGANGNTLATVAVFGVAWGIGALTFGLGVDALGLALGFAVILGTTALFGTIIPLIATPPANFSQTQMAITAVSLLLMVAGVVMCSFAGKWKESNSARKSYRRGLFICLVSGLLSSCGNLGLVFGRQITTRAEKLGVPAHLAPNAVWTLLTLPLFLCNAGYALYLMRKNSSIQHFRSNHAPRCFALAVSMGVLWMAGFSLYGMGARRLGELGQSLGWAMLMSTIVLVANGLGIATGEWKSAPAPSKRQLSVGVFILICAVTGLGFANR